LPNESQINPNYKLITKNQELITNTKGKAKRFSPPSLLDVVNYCFETKCSVDPETFVNFYESKGWMVGKNKMKDWKAAVRQWNSRSKSKPQNNKSNETREKSLIDDQEGRAGRSV